MNIDFSKVANSLIQTGWHFNAYDKIEDIPQDSKTLCVLIDIAKSLRAIRKQIECPNVRDGLIAMQVAATLLRTRLPVPKKAKRKPAAKNPKAVQP